MIDPHVHLRGWDWAHKETLEHGLEVAWRAGLSGVFDMPNVPLDGVPIISRELVMRRLGDAERAQEALAEKDIDAPFYGLYVGITSDSEQIREAVWCCNKLPPNGHIGVVGLKKFACHSVGDLAIPEIEDQKKVYETLAREGFDGVLAVHCEKESLMQPKVWNPKNPRTHSLARPAVAENYSVLDQITFAQESGFPGHLHILHVSDPISVFYVNEARRKGMRISCGVTPHHLMLNEKGLLGKVNPPIRGERERKELLEELKQGRIDFIESDHAPHTLAEKMEEPYMSGIVGLPIMALMPKILRAKGFSPEVIDDLTHGNIEKVFGFEIPRRNVVPEMDLHTEYPGLDVYEDVRRELC